MKYILKNVAEVISGFSFRKNNFIFGKDILVIQARDINGDINLNLDNLIGITEKNVNTKAFVKRGDIVIAERGAFRSGLVKNDVEKIIATSSTLILRPISKNINPEYLVAYFNSKIGNNNILRAAKGSIIKNISKREFENLEIPIPAIEEQELIVKMYKNNREQQKLLERKKELVGQVVESVIKQILTNKNI